MEKKKFFLIKTNNEKTGGTNYKPVQKLKHKSKKIMCNYYVR